MSITFEFGGRKMTLHRPHPGKEALRYRVLAVAVGAPLERAVRRHSAQPEREAVLQELWLP